MSAKVPTVTGGFTAAPSQVFATSHTFLSEVHLDNVKAGAIIVQLFDAASLPSNGATPVFEWEVAQSESLIVQFRDPIRFDTGVVAAVSSTKGSLTVSLTSDLIGCVITKENE